MTVTLDNVGPFLVQALTCNFLGSSWPKKKIRTLRLFLSTEYHLWSKLDVDQRKKKIACRFVFILQVLLVYESYLVFVFSFPVLYLLLFYAIETKFSIWRRNSFPMKSNHRILSQFFFFFFVKLYSKPEVTDPSGGVEKQPENPNPSSEQAKLQSEKSNPQLEIIEPQPKTQTNSADLSSIAKAKKHIALSMVRRSQRLQSAATSSQDKDIERVIEEMTMSECEKNEEPLNLEEAKLPEPILMHKSLEEKVDYLLQQFEEQKTIEALKFKVTRDSSPTGSPKAADVRYRNLCFDSQKKIEALTDENHQLALKLERALGKLEAYENGARVFSEGLEKVKDVILITNLTRATENAVNFSSRAFTSMNAGAGAKTTAKRKRLRSISK
ncbi:hypothetical protein CRYUN_Cryun23aG0088900 [Craigia yunnanensis]